MQTTNNLPYPPMISSGCISGISNSTSYGTYNATSPDFSFSTRISNEIRKYEPEKFYLLVEMLCEHMKKFNGDFPGCPGITYEVQIDKSLANELSYQIIFRNEEQ